MKILITALTLLFSLPSLAGVDLDKLSGTWSMSCTQSQNSDGKQGFMTETYSFEKTGNYKLLRQWFEDSTCKSEVDSELESGSIVIGKENTNNGFNPAGTFEVKYNTPIGVELGLLWVNPGYSKMRIARGFGNTQNTMLGIFEYKKQ